MNQRDYKYPDPFSEVDPAEFKRQVRECRRRLDVWSAQADRKSAAVARERLDYATAVWLHESGLPKELGS